MPLKKFGVPTKLLVQNMVWSSSDATNHLLVVFMNGNCLALVYHGGVLS
jgi:hypothetical protein